MRKVYKSVKVKKVDIFIYSKESHFFSLNHNLHIHMIVSRAQYFYPFLLAQTKKQKKKKKHLLRPSLFYSLESQYKFNPSPSLPI